MYSSLVTFAIQCYNYAQAHPVVIIALLYMCFKFIKFYMMPFPEYEGHKIHSIETVAQWKAAVKEHDYVFADFYGTHCPPCRQASPIFGKLSTEYPNVHFVKVNSSTASEVFKLNEVSAMPTFIFYKNKIKRETIVGWKRKKVEKCLRQYTKLTKDVQNFEEEPKQDCGDKKKHE